MKERPILFSAPMVRALLDGTKSQTRRQVRLPRNWVPNRDELPDMLDGALVIEPRGIAVTDQTEDTYDLLPCPYGAPGDRLWVRETWAWDGAASRLVEYRADWSCRRCPPGVRCEHGPDRWRPSIYMPRWASRIVLELTSVRAERLHAITPADAIAEGVGGLSSYRSLWDGINGAGAWRLNPWVWVLGLRRVTP